MQGHLYLLVYTFAIDWWCHNVLTYSLFSVSAWSYIDHEFTTTQKILSLNIPISFGVLVMTSTGWHNFEQLKKGSLRFLQEAVIMPFFLPSMCMKLLNLGIATCYTSIITFTYTSSLPLTAFVIMAILLTLFAFQATVHSCLGYSMKEDPVLISVLANLTSNARPNTTGDNQANDKAKRFYKIETVMSTLVYTIMATCNALYIFLFEAKDKHFAFISFGFILLHLVFTQLYLWTSTGNRLLFPEAVETDQPVGNSKEESSQQPEQLERRKTGRVIVIVSIAITVGLFCYVGVILTQGKKNLSDSTITNYLAA